MASCLFKISGLENIAMMNGMANNHEAQCFWCIGNLIGEAWKVHHVFCHGFE